MNPALIFALLFEQPAEPETGCFSSDIQQLCCPSACAVKGSSSWQKADEVLRGGVKALGCSDARTKSSSVFKDCTCPKSKGGGT
jgi:hypothetical protein